MNDFIEKFRQRLENLSISLEDFQLKQFMDYYEMLLEKNKVMNLTAITEPDEVMEKHFLDSLSLVHAVDLSQKLSVLDVGTGAGFPGIPLKIAFPELSVTLLDSLRKRVDFLNEVIQRLELADIRAFHGRAEDFAQKKEHREQYDLCVSRAVANLSTLSEYCLPFVKVGGQFVSYKSKECDSEIKSSEKAVALLGGERKKVYKFDLGESKRALILIHKVQNTPKRYPRKSGTPSKTPIL